ncbi:MULTISPECIES: trehalose-phosphatase [unclassified Beijerinckia]|uniref:trehalose-phosphatase n=1 Tax=unclassified Beijerinckia TaxID=2638183 RepID=UPI0008990FB8|nr:MULTISPECIES: trehalose-phosphatase [unclassified Beijerinckia]MDH7795876.1 trehalose 6-phosphate phosphatase [Beijerinckia sp. GAS462]SEC20279.1 trehalose 6-phosphatase [Beijerinckia sp. 28-YEA-48]
MTTQTWSLFLDFDGTLVDIASRPDNVVIDSSLVATLQDLQLTLDGRFAIVSGRSLQVLDGFLRPLMFDAAGLHGLETRAGDITTRCDATSRPELMLAADRVRAAMDPIDGVIVEDKGCAFSVHWRKAVESEKLCRHALSDALKSLGSDYRLQLGKCVGEILPAEASKGHAIADFLKHPLYRNSRPIFIGDDLTDEDGFRVVNDNDGVSIHVGGLDTIAKHRLASPAAVLDILKYWAHSGQFGSLFKLQDG